MRVLKAGLQVRSPYFLLGLFLLIACSIQAQQGSNKIPNLQGSEFTEKSGATGWAIGQKVPDLKILDVFGKKKQLHDLLGKPLVIEFFELNDAQSTKNKKILNAFYKQYNINILSITTDQHPFQIQKYAKANGMTWPVVQDDYRTYHGKSFAQTHISNDVAFLLVYPDGSIQEVLNNPKAIGRIGVALQQYFNK